MKILHLVSVADAQSIPLELALELKRHLPDTVIASFAAEGDHPPDHDRCSVVHLNAAGPFDPAAIARLRALLRAKAPDIVHVHHAVSAFWCTLAAQTIRPRPILVKTEHNDHRSQRWHQTAINLSLYPVLDAILCNSDTTLASFSKAERLFSRGKAQRIYNGVDLSAIRAKTRVPPGRDGVVRIGHVGRLVPQKNQTRLIEGLAVARAASGRDIRLEIVGHGPLLGQLQAVARRAGVADAVRFSGGLTRDAVYDRLQRWDAFVMPSCYEGFCNALVEAMAADLPVAVADIATLREVGGAGALRFDPLDARAIGAALIDLSHRGRGPHSVVGRYDMPRAVRDHIAFYHRLLGARRPGAPIPRCPGSVPGE